MGNCWVKLVNVGVLIWLSALSDSVMRLPLCDITYQIEAGTKGMETCEIFNRNLQGFLLAPTRADCTASSSNRAAAADSP
jgi:hypothetical protein